MNKYRIAAIALLALLLLPILLCMIKWIIPIGCNSVCPNRNFFGVTVKDVPRPVPNPPCPACPPACPPCSGGGTAPAASSGGTTTLNHNSTNTNANDCSGATIQLPPVSGGIAGIGTSCMTVGKSFVVDLGNCTDCPNPGVVVCFAAADDSDIYIQIDPNTIQTWTGGPGSAPYANPNQQAPIPIVPPLRCAAPSQFKFTLVSDTQIDIYYNGTKIGTVPKPSFQIATIWLAACASPPGSNAYGAFV